jgi:hypothetical protein
VSCRHWIWIAVGLLSWAALVFVWATSPDICDNSLAASSDHCLGRSH